MKVSILNNINNVNVLRFIFRKVIQYLNIYIKCLFVIT